MRIVATAVLWLLGVYLVALPPHLVHHLFGEERHDQPPCPHLAHGQNTSELSIGVPDVPGPPEVESLPILPAVARTRGAASGVSASRAPPGVLPAA